MSKKSFFKTTLIATTLLAASGYTMMAQAHCIGGNGNFDPTGLGAPLTSPIITTVLPFKIDSYTTVCPAGTKSIKAGIAKRSGAAGTVALEVVKFNGLGTHATVQDASVTAAAACGATIGTVDFISGTSGAVYNGGFTTEAASTPFVAGALASDTDGQYILNVTADTGTPEYAIEFHCYNKAANPITVANEINPSAPNGGSSSTEFDRILDH